MDNKQPEINIGMLGHVDHGKTTLTKVLTGKWTDTHSEEIKRGITIRIGYAELSIYKCEKCGIYTNKEICHKCGGKALFKRKVSFVDAPGHESLMASVISASSILDGALFIIAANEKCPQEQTKEHLLLLDLLGIKNIVIVQTKIDLVTKERAIEHYNEIKEFVQGTVAENAPIIPVSSTYELNWEYVIEAIEEFIPTPQRDESAEPIAYSIRSFDINPPGRKIEEMVGGVIGGSVVQGVLKINDKIEIKPGLKKDNSYIPIYTEIEKLATGNTFIEKARPGGLIAISTRLDPSLTKSDNLSGNIIGLEGSLPEPQNILSFSYELIERTDIDNSPLKPNEVLLLNIHTTPTVGVIKHVKKDYVEVAVKRPVVLLGNDKIAISRRIGSRWRLVGLGISQQ